MVDLIVDDNKMDEALTKTAVQKEIFQDGVKFIIVDEWCEASLPVVEENKIICTMYPVGFEMYNPKWHWFGGRSLPYGFCGGDSICRQEIPR